MFDFCSIWLLINTLAMEWEAFSMIMFSTLVMAFIVTYYNLEVQGVIIGFFSFSIFF